MKEFDGQIELSGDQPDRVVDGVWSGEIVQVDETNGRIFVCVSEADGQPTTGTFFVRSFDTMRHLQAVFCDPAFEDVRDLLPSRLSACRGRVRAEIDGEISGGLPELNEIWRHAWGMIWAPPGTGKTDLIGRQLAACSGDATERFLVVSTSNKATDAAAISIGLHWQRVSSEAIVNGQVRRIGMSPFSRNFVARNLGGVLCASDQAAHFVSRDDRVIVATAHKVLDMVTNPAIHSMIASGHAPFTTVVVDEAGQLPRAVVAVLSLLASRRVVLAGDSKQLEPVSRTSRVQPTNQATWLSRSALHDLRSFKQKAPQLHLLYEQHRMHPDVRKIVSVNQYEDKLTDAPSVLSRQFPIPPLLADQPRTIWYVLDAEGDDIASIRAGRGPAGRSWIRAKTRDVLNRILADPQMRQLRGHFVTPFVAQAHDVSRLFAELGQANWTADTVHGQQVSEADLVVFDTVNAGSCGWTEDQWQRVMNVGMSQARQFMMLLASRAEMEQPFLKRLLPYLAPRVLVQSGDSLAWRPVPQVVEQELTIEDEATESPELMGDQLSNRRRLRPVMSAEQQTLCGLTMDGRPRLVRGVAGSGKTVVMAHWIVKTVMKMADRPDAKIWAVYANTALKGLIGEAIDEAWKVDHNGTPFPWERVSLFHVREVLELMLPEVGVKMYASDYEYDRASNAYLQRRSPDEITPRCDAMFIDEAQDMGPHTIKLLNLLVAQTDEDDPNSRCVNVFYDDGQNVHDRDVPKWSELGLDVRGRSTVMKESFRSTKPITEMALNVLYRLQPPEAEGDHVELIKRGLIERSHRDGETWWNVRFNQVDGPLPVFRQFAKLDSELDAMGDQIVQWIRDEGVAPRDICILHHGKFIAKHIKQQVGPKLADIDAELVVQNRPTSNRDERTVIVTTPHAFKGYDAEIAVIAGVDEFVTSERGILANSLYVAMTRARSILAMFGKRRESPDVTRLLSTIAGCWNNLLDDSQVDGEISEIDDFEEIIDRIGHDHRRWLASLWHSHHIQQEPITAPDGEILGEPLFWFEDGERIRACFASAGPGRQTRFKMEDSGIEIIQPGQQI